MKQLYQQLGIKAIKISPNHLQTDGLVERFNQTLKNMLRKFVADTDYREVPQASTGFAPFELLYRWPVQGPLDILLNSTENGIVQYVLDIRDRLDKYQEDAKENLQRAQRSQKAWYDHCSRQREYKPGQKVLLLLPSSANKLLAQWQGPYTISLRIGPVTYEVSHPEKGKNHQTYHINLLKHWKERSSPEVSLMVCKVNEDKDVSCNRVI